MSPLRPPNEPGESARLAALCGRQPSRSELDGIRETLHRFYFPHRARADPLPRATLDALARVADGFESARLRGALLAAMGGDPGLLGPPLDSGDSRLEVDAPLRAAGGHDEDEGLLAFFREHVIRVRSMPLPLRLITGLAIAQVVVVGLLLILDSRNWPEIPVYVQFDRVFSVPIPVIVVTLICLTAAWTYIVAATLHAHPWLRPLGLVGFLIVQWREREVFAADSGWRFVALAALAGLAALCAYTVLHDRRQGAIDRRGQGHHHRPVPVTLLVTLLAIGTVFLAAWEGRAPHAFSFSGPLHDELAMLAVLLIPALLLAGVDFAEVSQIAAERLGAFANRWRPPLIPVLLLAIVLGVVGLVRIRPLGQSALEVGDYDHAHLALVRLGSGALIVGLGGLFVWLTRAHHAELARRIPYSALVAAVGGTYLISAVVLATYGHPYDPAKSVLVPTPEEKQDPGNALLDAGRKYGFTYGFHELEPIAFSLARPGSWVVERGVEDTHMSGPIDGAAGHVDIIRVPSHADDPAAAIPEVIVEITGTEGALAHAAVTTSQCTADGPWVRCSVAIAGGSAAQTGSLWIRLLDGHAWAVVGWADTAVFNNNAILWDAITESWDPGPDGYALKHRDETTTRSVDATYALAGNIDPEFTNDALTRANRFADAFLVAGAIGLGLLVRFSRGLRARRALGAAAVYIAFCAVFAIFTNASPIQLQLSFISQFGGALNLLGTAFVGSQAVTGIASALALIVLLGRRRLGAARSRPITLLLGINLSLLAVTGLFAFFDQAQHGGLPFPEALIILLALGWDVLMSGDAVTNRTSRWAPRHSRVLLFFGYIMMVTTLLLFFSTQTEQATGKVVEPLFNSEYWPQQGMLAFGAPLIGAAFLLNLGRWLRRARQTAAAG